MRLNDSKLGNKSKILLMLRGWRATKPSRRSVLRPDKRLMDSGAASASGGLESTEPRSRLMDKAVTCPILSASGKKSGSTFHVLVKKSRSAAFSASTAMPASAPGSFEERVGSDSLGFSAGSDGPAPDSPAVRVFSGVVGAAVAVAAAESAAPAFDPSCRAPLAFAEDASPG